MPQFLRPATTVLPILLSILLGACATRDAAPPAALTVVIVRHAEKAIDDTRDPPLTAAGIARAEALAAALASAPVVAVYATGYQRTRQTAAPTARVHGLPVTSYDAKAPAADFAAQLRRRHRHGHVLVVAHSNTAPDIAAALCGCQVAPMDESEYGRRMTVHIAPEGAVTLLRTAAAH